MRSNRISHPTLAGGAQAAKPFRYGGQSIIEGVMMRGSHTAATAARKPDGEIVLRVDPLNAALYRGPVSRIPLLRGLTSLWDSLGLGTRALMWSADVALGEEETSGAFQGALGWLTGLIGVAVGVGLFMALPSLAAGLLSGALSPLAGNILEGLIRLLLLIGYIWAVGHMPEIERVFGYHGAEHKTVNAHEAGAPLTVASVQTFSTAHARCGTALLLTVVLISILVLAPLGAPTLMWRVASRLLAIPLITGLAYEWIRLSARLADRPWMRLLIAPNLALQRLTTREPDDQMVEVAIRALETVLANEKGLDT